VNIDTRQAFSPSWCLVLSTIFLASPTSQCQVSLIPNSSSSPSVLENQVLFPVPLVSVQGSKEETAGWWVRQKEHRIPGKAGLVSVPVQLMCDLC
jgi:hypothetical protein